QVPGAVERERSRIRCGGIVSRAVPSEVEGGQETRCTAPSTWRDTAAVEGKRAVADRAVKWTGCGSDREVVFDGCGVCSGGEQNPQHRDCSRGERRLDDIHAEATRRGRTEARAISGP